MTKERRHGCPETYFTSQGCVTQSTLRLKQEVKTTVFLVTKPKLAFIGARPMYGLPVSFVLQVAFDAGGPILFPLLWGPSPQTTCGLRTMTVLSLILYSPLKQLFDNIY